MSRKSTFLVRLKKEMLQTVCNLVARIVRYFLLQTSLSLPASPFNLRRASRGSHQFTLRSSRPRFPAASDTRPLVLNNLLDAQVSIAFNNVKHRCAEHFGGLREIQEWGLQPQPGTPNPPSPL